MMSFVPITETFIAADGVLIAIGAARLPEIGRSTKAFEALWQMSGSSFAGEAAVELFNGQARIRARYRRRTRRPPRSGLSIRSVCGFERGKVRMRAANLAAIGAVFGAAGVEIDGDCVRLRGIRQDAA